MCVVLRRAGKGPSAKPAVITCQKNQNHLLLTSKFSKTNKTNNNTTTFGHVSLQRHGSIATTNHAWQNLCHDVQTKGAWANGNLCEHQHRSVWNVQNQPFCSWKRQQIQHVHVDGHPNWIWLAAKNSVHLCCANNKLKNPQKQYQKKTIST